MNSPAFPFLQAAGSVWFTPPALGARGLPWDLPGVTGLLLDFLDCL